jgi:hypothetical protein
LIAASFSIAPTSRQNGALKGAFHVVYMQQLMQSLWAIRTSLGSGISLHLSSFNVGFIQILII